MEILDMDWAQSGLLNYDACMRCYQRRNCILFQEIPKEFLSSMHERLLTVVQPKIAAELETQLADFNVMEQLQSLDQLVAATPHSTTHQVKSTYCTAAQPITSLKPAFLSKHHQ